MLTLDGSGKLRDRGVRDLALPVRERLAEAGLHLGSGHVSDNHREGAVRTVAGLVVGDDVLAGQGREGGIGAEVRAAIRVLAEDGAVVGGPQDGIRVVERAAQAGDRLLTRPIELLGAERRLRQHVPEQLEADGEILLEDGEACDRHVGIRAHGQRAAHEVDRMGDLGGRARRGALGHEIRGEVGDARLTGRLIEAAGAEDHLHLNQRQVMPLDQQDLEAVGEAEFLGLGKRLEDMRLGRGGLRLGGLRLGRLRRGGQGLGHGGGLQEHGGGQQHAGKTEALRFLGRDHFCSSLAEPADSGIRVTTERFSLVKYVLATRLTSSALTART
ncbi:hypothetical protein D3C87_1288530 [compost metagenome]